MDFLNYFKNQNFIFYIITFLIFNLIVGVLGIVLNTFYLCIKNIEENMLNENELEQKKKTN